CDSIEDATEQVREQQEERLRFRALSRTALDGQSKALAARTAAVLWLRLPGRSSSSSSRPALQARFHFDEASE
ncbi:unnamed protein product, partial [Polarella glacialis]